jgi:branched-chain amino acid transport system substrate-binding protein
MTQSRYQTSLAIAAAVGSTLLVSGPKAALAEQTQPLLVTSYRVGAFAPSGVPLADGYIDYIKLLNARDGGINGVKLSYSECETRYENDRGIDCYERFKVQNGQQIPGIAPMSGGIAFSLYKRAMTDKMPIITEGHGRLEGEMGAYFPYDFPIMGNDWDQTNAILEFIGKKEGGIENLKGKKIAFVFLDGAYGRTPFPVLEAESKRLGFSWDKYAISASAMVDQRSTWLAIRRSQPNYVLIWGWGIMNSTALKEAAATGFPIERIIGNWFSAAEPDVTPVRNIAKGYIGATFRMPGKEYGVIRDIKTYVYDKGLGAGEWNAEVGSVLYNQGVAVAFVQTEAIRKAMQKFGNRPVNGDETRWGLEHLDLNEAALQSSGLAGIIAPLKLTCEDHKGAGSLRFIQWDGEKWNPISDWIDGRRDSSKAVVLEDAKKLAAELGYKKRDCSVD